MTPPVDGVQAPSPARFLLIALIVPALLIGLFGWLRTEYGRSEQVRAQLVRSYDRRIDQLHLLSRLKDAETAQRGYLLTGDPAFLAPFDPARRDIERRLADAADRADPKVPSAYPPLVRQLVALKFAELDGTIKLVRAGERARALQIVVDGSGLRIMDRLRTVIGAMAEAEERRTTERRAAYLAYRAQLQRILLIVIGVLVAIVLIALSSIWRLRQQRHASLVEAFEAAERNATILNSTTDALLTLNPSGTVEGTNAAATRMLGYAPADLQGRDIGAILDLPRTEGSFHQRVGLVDGQLRQGFLPDRLVRHHDGRAVAVDVAMGVMALPSGLHIVVSLRDISERKRVERLKGDLMSTVSHELRTPLTSVVGSLGLLRAGAAGKIPAAAARLVEIAENNSRRLIRLINDMLDIDRIESGKLDIEQVPIDLRAVLDQACVGSEGLARAKGATIDCHTPASPVVIAGDHDRLLQVVTNLASNGIRAGAVGATLDMSVVSDGVTATVLVEDRGAGVPLAFRDRIFGRFERATPDDGATGTGLGLAISREIVIRHGGKIWFEDRAGGGTRFAFSVPLLGRAASADPGAAAVLVCEEDDEVARQLIAIVAAEGCAYDLVRSADEARAAIARRTYTAILVGISLPEEGGIAFAQAARDGDPPVNVPIVVVARATTGGNDLVGLDVVDRVDKPADPRRLSLAIRSALARANARQPIILHLDDDRDLLEVVAAAIEPEARIVTATDLDSARSILQRTSPDVAILDMKLANGSGLDLLPFLTDADGVAIPTIIYSAQDVSPELARSVDAVLVKARGSIPDLKATIRRVLELGGTGP